MAPGDQVGFEGIPFLSRERLRMGNCFLGSIIFFDGDWRTWAPIAESRDRFIEVRAWPAEAFYFASAPQHENDICSEFLDFIAQHANQRPIMRQFAAIQDDFLNLGASLAKLDLIFKTGDKHGGSHRLAATEVEYILFVCRSVFDLLQEIVQHLWTSIQLHDASVVKKALKQSFAEMTLHSKEFRSAEQIAERYGLPAPLAECYAGNAPTFLLIRGLRDDLAHRGHKVDTIFRGDDQFLIARSLGSFRTIDIWRPDELLPNNLVPLKPVLDMIITGALAACEDFALTLKKTIQWPVPMVPGMRLFMRGYYNRALKAALADADGRMGEGRSLVSNVVHTPH